MFSGLLPIGHPGVFRVRDKILMFFHLTRTNMPPPSPGIEPLSVVVPIVYDIETNQTSIPQKDQININNPVMIGAQQILVNLANSGKNDFIPTIEIGGTYLDTVQDFF